jgi:hypothetical protein
MISGRDALFSIEQAIGRVRGDERGLDEALRSAMADAHRLRHEVAEGFRARARARLDAMVRDQVIGDLDETERQALAILDRGTDHSERSAVTGSRQSSSVTMRQDGCVVRDQLATIGDANGPKIAALIQRTSRL